MRTVGYYQDDSKNFDVALGEHINHCRADDVPCQTALDTVAAVRRFLPRLRGSTTTAQSYLRKRQIICDAQRATPLLVCSQSSRGGRSCHYLCLACGRGHSCWVFRVCCAQNKFSHICRFKRSLVGCRALPFKARRNHSLNWCCRVGPHH